MNLLAGIFLGLGIAIKLGRYQRFPKDEASEGQGRVLMVQTYDFRWGDLFWS